MIYPLANLFGEWQWVLIALAALILFGKRLPEVGRSLGQGIVEFKKGLSGIENEIEQSANRPTPPSINRLPEAPASTAGYKFDPYTGQPLANTQPPQMRFDPYTGKPLSSETATTVQSGNNIGA